MAICSRILNTLDQFEVIKCVIPMKLLLTSDSLIFGTTTFVLSFVWQLICRMSGTKQILRKLRKSFLLQLRSWVYKSRLPDESLRIATKHPKGCRSCILQPSQSGWLLK
nr:MAG TPA: hypothetical protein [Caudoviricetes sp.]